MKKRSKLFIVPAFIIYTVLMIIPIIGAFGLSFTDWNGISADYDFVGIQNYLSMLSDARLGNAVAVTLKITVTVVLVVNILGLFIAILLSQAGKLTNIFRSVFFLPYVLSTVATCTAIVNAMLSSARMPNNADPMARCPELLTGRYSVSPWSKPRTSASNQSIRRCPPCFCHYCVRHCRRPRACFWPLCRR